MASQTKRFCSSLSLFFRRERGSNNYSRIVVVGPSRSSDFPRCENCPPLFFLFPSFSLLLFTFSSHSLESLSLNFTLSSTLNMSTSGSTAPPSALGECVVCGKETSTRCSSCAKGGVDWMFFCSREHQRLVSELPRPVSMLIELTSPAFHFLSPLLPVGLRSETRSTN